jgi:Secretion system C-terminal sorting domain
MKITKLFTIVSFILLSFTTHAQLYSALDLSTPVSSSGYNPANENQIAFEKVLVSPTLMDNKSNITISQLKLTILRLPGAPQVTATIWVGYEDDNTGYFSAVAVGSKLISGTNGASNVTQNITLGNGISTFYTTPPLSAITYTELFVGIQFSNADPKNLWQYAALPVSPNSCNPYLDVYNEGSYGSPADSPYKPFTQPFTNVETAMGLQIFGNPGGSLPIELTKFNATQTDKFQSTLTWQTASESNNQGFQIEKSLDGSVFKNIGFVKGVDNSNVSNNYNFRDNDFSKSAYFRLKQIDFDGKYSYSTTVYVEKSQVGKVKTLVYPNPSLGKFYVDHATDVKNITVFNLTGQAVFNQNVNEAERTEIDISNLATGLYFVRLNDNKGHIETKQVKIVSQ